MFLIDIKKNISLLIRNNIQLLLNNKTLLPRHLKAKVKPKPSESKEKTDHY